MLANAAAASLVAGIHRAALLLLAAWAAELCIRAARLRGTDPLDTRSPPEEP